MFRSAIGVSLLVTVCGIASQQSHGESETAATLALRQALESQTRWLATSPAGVGWTRYLKIDQLREQLAAPSPDRSQVEMVLDRYRAARPGLESKEFVNVRGALEGWFEQIPLTNEQLIALVRSTRDQFAVPKPEDEAAARSELRSATAELDRYLAPQGTNGRRWGQFLLIDELKAQLQAQASDPDRLAEVAGKFSGGHFGLQLKPFGRVRRALNDYLRISRTLSNPQSSAEHAADIDRLAVLVEQYAAQPGGELSLEIGALLGRLAARGQSQRVVAAIRNRYARPDLFVRVSEVFIARALAERVVETEQVREFFQGARISGTAQTAGEVTLHLVPNDRRAVLQAIFLGTTLTRTVGVSGPASVYSSGTTRLDAQQYVYIDGDGVHAGAPWANAKTSIRTTGIGTASCGIRGCVVERVASKRVAEAKPEAERTTSRKARSRLNQRLASRVDKLVSEANQRYWQQIRQPLTAKNQFPQTFLIRTTVDELLASGVMAGPSQLGASSLPPDLPAESDLAVRLHETAVNNFAQGVLAGETIHSDDVRNEMFEIAGALPERFQDEEGKAPWSITFADEKPIEVQFADGGFTITVRGKQYTSDERTYRAMNVTAIYKVEAAPTGMRAVRQGDLQIFPPGFVPGSRRFSVPEQTLRSMLERRFGRLFTPELGGEPMQPPGRFANVGPLVISNLATQNGWVTIGWRPVAAGTAIAVAD